MRQIPRARIKEGRVLKAQFIIAIVIVLFNLVTRAHSNGVTPKNLHYIIGCSIYNWEGLLIKAFPGDFCAFAKNGTVYSGSYTNIKAYNPKQEVLWTLNHANHHQMNFNLDASELLVLSSKIVTLEGKRIYSDVFLRVSLDGKILAEQSFENIQTQSGLSRPPLIIDKAAPQISYMDVEKSHFNSFYEIPQNMMSKKMPAFKMGNFIINDRDAGLVILSKDLKNVLWTFKPNWSVRGHDAQVLKSGNIIYFNNENINAAGPYSSIDELNPLSKQLTSSFSSNPKEFFYSQNCGGIQILNLGMALISDVRGNFYIYDRSTKKITYYNSIVANNIFWSGVNQPVQQVKAENLSSFLTAWGIKDSAPAVSPSPGQH